MNQDDKIRSQQRAEKLLGEQNFTAAAIAGAVAAVLAAVAFAIVTWKWPFSYGFAAVGIGIMVGAAMQYLGRGIETKFAVLAAIYTVLGCALGIFLRESVTLSPGEGFLPVFALRQDELSLLVDKAAANVSAIVVVFWLVAVWCAVFLVKRPLSRADRLAIGTRELVGK